MNVATTVKGMEDAWPSDIEDSYDRIRLLGEGGFGKVWLAKKTGRPSPQATDTPREYDEDEEEYVAIKQIGIKRQIQDRKFIAREIAILRELHHPNIIQCLNSANLPNSTLVVLTLAYGPNLGDIVRYGGAVSVSLARLVSRQLISAVAYLHGRGVIHRDIKPDNCILTRCNIINANATTQYDIKDANSWKTNDNLWDDNAIFNEKEWRMKLVDFGFARALTPAECGVENNNQRRPSISDLIQRGITNEQTRRRSSGNGAVEENDDAAINDTLSKLRRKSFFTRRSNSLDEEEMVNGATTTTDDSSSSRRRSSLFGRKFKRLNSIEKKPIRAMSALGTLDYAAPEVKNSRDKCEGDVALTDLVADYGLIADAYSVGCTIREILTGVPAKEARNEMDFMSTHQNSIDLVALFSCCTGTSNSNNKRKKRKRRYKWLDETPKLARELVLKMMNIKIADRLTVPLAREELWIKGGMSSDDPIVTLPVGDVSAGINDPIDFLQCTTTMVTE